MDNTESSNKIFKISLLHSVCILFWIILSVGIFNLLRTQESDLVKAIVLIAAYFLTGWVLYEVFLKKRSKSAKIQAIIWCISTNPIAYLQWKYDIEWIVKLRIF